MIKLAPIASVVTESTWTRSARKHHAEQTYTSRTGHISNDCPKIADGTVVGLDVPLDSDDAGLPCDFCAVPNQRFIRDANEVDDDNRKYGDPAHPNHRRPASSSARPNRYAGNCSKCGVRVEAEAGLLGGRPGAWTVEHRDGGCPAAGTVRPVSTPVAAPVAPVVDVPAGHYAIESTGHNDLAFYRVDRPTDGKWAGRTFVKLVVGGHPDQNVRRDHVAGILARIAADGIVEAGRRYGREIGRCCRCNRTLTDETSRAAGIGPECATKA